MRSCWRQNHSYGSLKTVRQTFFRGPTASGFCRRREKITLGSACSRDQGGSKIARELSGEDRWMENY